MLSVKEEARRKALADKLQMKSEIVFNTQEYTVHLLETASEFDISVYPLGTKHDEDMGFNNDLMIDGGIVQDGDCLDAINYAFEF